jgi:hypothetical protein
MEDTPHTTSATAHALDVIADTADSMRLELLGSRASLDASEGSSDRDREEGRTELTSPLGLLFMEKRYRWTQHIGLSTWSKAEAVEELKEIKVHLTRVSRLREETKALEEPKEAIHLLSRTESILPENQSQALETQELLLSSSTSTSTSEDRKSSTFQSTPEDPGDSTETSQGEAQRPQQTEDGVNYWWVIGVGVVVLSIWLRRW